MNKRDLNERLIDFAVMIITVTDNLLSTRASNHLAGQLVRSGTSPALNYGEAQSGESRKDFVHKLQIVLKELRETMNALKIIRKANLYRNSEFLDMTLKENNELIAIFVTSVETAKRNDKSKGGGND
jgi:four helix bundle protein